MSKDEAKEYNPIIGLKVEYSDPEEAISMLSLKLVESLSGQSNWGKDAASFAKEANNFEAKATASLKVVNQVKERDRLIAIGEEYVSTSRMDPIATYSLSSVVQEYEKYKAQSKEFRENSEEFLRLAAEAGAHAEELQAKIRKLHMKV